MYRFLLVGVLFFGALCITTPVQAIDVPGSVNMLSISLYPESPQPYGDVIISPQSNLLDLSTQTIQILVNGTEIEKGSGKISAHATVGGPGSATVIKIIATNSAGVSSQSEVTLRPADVALIVEPNTTTHPFYEGGALVAPESPIRVVAITDFRNAAGAQIPSSSLIYTWKFGNRVLQSDSGIGRSTLNAIAPVKYRDADITLTVQSPDGSLVGEASVAISPADPLVLLYQHDPLLGVLFNTAILNTFSMTGTEATFRVLSYYFATLPRYAWNVNSAASGSGSDLTVRANGKGVGTAVVGVEATDQSGKTAGALLSVLFGNNPSSGIFGL